MGSKLKAYTLFGFTLVVTTLAILGVVTGLILTENRGPGPWPQVNHFQTVWYCLVLSFVAIQSIIIQATPDIIDSGPSKAWILLDNVYYGFILVLSLIHCISWAVFGRADLAIISAFTILLAASNAFLQSFRFHQATLARPDNRLKPDSSRSIVAMVALGLNSTLKALFLVICVLLSLGSIVHSLGLAQYPIIPGKYLTYSLDEAHTQTIYYRCEGNTTDLPPIIFESDGSHGLGDWLGILNAMEGRHRICVWDKPGLGFSDYMRFDQEQPIQFYHELIQALARQEPEFAPPYAFVGWGGGLNVIYQYALDHPENVHSLINLDGALEGVEFRLPAIINNLTETQAQEQFEADMRGRFQTFSLINGLGIPFGLVQFFISKQVHIILTHQSEEQVDTLVCQPRNLTLEACQFEKDYNRMIYEEKLAYFPQNGGHTVECTMDECNLGFYVFTNSSYTVQTVLDLLQ
ncbi:hypothetical protein TCAL_03167 [Tigriopus californicus]|uniref:AB hydrolase-1 domain-containing protein n=1 Tax=Tigriopus californicus TaxID=6832 RepID=A0A553N7U1_TIGCA|nr:hypothetical protein TCAL_03167 [Tigriopus californicus]|eukprot:TCALIF_03167-PA protein Name:"Protein of unknown function" AED:0.13 eAED:0.13 QI:0/0.6/0.5/0.83/1/1/6/126/462